MFRNYIVIVFVLGLVCGCKSVKEVKETITLTDTTFVTRDSIIIRDRIVPVEVAIPVSSQTISLPLTSDTTSVLQDDLYMSFASVRDGYLHHSLISKAGARLTAHVETHDTTKTQTSATTINNEKTKTETKIITTNKLTKFQKVMQALGWIFVAIAGWFIYVKIRKILLKR